MRAIKALTLEEYQSLTRDALVLSRDEHGDKVLQTPQGMIIKLFRRKRLISSALLRPYAVRFVNASRRLRELGIPSVQVQSVLRVPALTRHLVIYPRLDGITLRQAVLVIGRRDVLLEKLARFLAMLHGKGVYFRAMHFGNVLVMNDGNLALIDISETRFRSGRLSADLRTRNFRPLTSYPEDLQALRDFGMERFLETYHAAADLNPAQRARFDHALQRVLW